LARLEGRQHMAEDDDVEVIKPPNIIKSKVVEGGPGAVSEETLERAESVITREIGAYDELVKEDLKKLRAGIERLKSTASEPQEALEEVFFVSHNIKGQAGSFGYDLLTRIADRLCRIIEYLDAVKPKELKVIEICVLSMHIAAAKPGKVKSDVDGQALLEGLDLIIAKFFPDQLAAANAAVQAAVGK